MQRTTKRERQDNAKRFYQLFHAHEKNRQCIVVNRNDNGRVQFLVVPGMLNWANPVVIAENRGLGIEGCWIELIMKMASKSGWVKFLVSKSLIMMGLYLLLRAVSKRGNYEI